VFGAFLASLALKYLFPLNEFLGSTIPTGSATQSFILEFILTFFLMLVIINVATGSKEQGMFAGPICGASMNPARSLAPAVISGHTEHLWIYLTATVVGAALAIPIWKFLSHNNDKVKP
jgi:aquaporin Z